MTSTFMSRTHGSGGGSICCSGGFTPPFAKVNSPYSIKLTHYPGSPSGVFGLKKVVKVNSGLIMREPLRGLPPPPGLDCE